MLDGLTSKLAAMAQLVRSEWAPEVDPEAGPVRRAAQVGTVITVVIIGVVALIGILIFAQVSDALPTIDNNQLDNSTTAVTDGFAGAMELIPVVLLVLVAALVIGVVQRMRMSG
jgi:uncharacterized membrane protein YjgN (DUF898 family)